MIRTLAIDVGGTGLKMIVLDEHGQPVTDRDRVLTPRPATPEAVLNALQGQWEHQGDFDRIAVGFPGVVVDGVTRTAPNLHPDWHGFALAAELQRRTGRPTRAANDADVQGLGVIEGRGVELVATLGTGLGGALFVDGRLVPNLELGHLPFKYGMTFEELLGDAGRKAVGKQRWSQHILDAIELWQRIFNFRLLHVGGGNVKKLKVELPVGARRADNVAGLLGGIALWRS